MKKLLIATSMLIVAACDTNDATPVAMTDAERAKEIAISTLIVDGHIDVPYRLGEKWVDISKTTESGDFDYPRAVSGGLNAPFMSIYTPASLDGTAEATTYAHSMIDIVERIAAESPDKFVIAKSTADVEAAFASGRVALPLGMENGSPINGSLETLDAFFERGIRYVTLAHSKSNHISDSSYDEQRKWDGLSEFGKQAIARMNSLGIMVDISHVSDDAFWATLEVAKAPMIASHSSARHFTPGFERNMDDKMIKALADNGGVIMINYGSSFITAAANGWRPARDAAYQAHLKENSLEDTDENQRAFMDAYIKATPYPYADIADVLDHIDHVVKIAGIDAVGIGSDYDGVGDTLPTGLKDVSTYPALIEGLLERGYSEDAIKKILSGNVMRVWKKVEEIAAGS